MKIQWNKKEKLLQFKDDNYTELAYILFKLRGLQIYVEFPTEWHEHGRTWIHIGLGIIKFAFSFKSKKVYGDKGQCSGPIYGFSFYEDILWLYHGQNTGYSKDGSSTTFYMPWHWNHKEHKILSNKETYDYTYTLKSGEIQKRTATIQKESRLWKRFWYPHKKYREYIDIEFDNEVGEETGTWKGGVLGCGYTMLPMETSYETLKRMEKERKF